MLNLVPGMLCFVMRRPTCWSWFFELYCTRRLLRLSTIVIKNIIIYYYNNNNNNNNNANVYLMGTCCSALSSCSIISESTLSFSSSWRNFVSRRNEKWSLYLSTLQHSIPSNGINIVYCKYTQRYSIYKTGFNPTVTKLCHIKCDHRAIQRAFRPTVDILSISCELGGRA